MNRYEALKHAAKAHAGERDRCRKDAILHPIAVAEAVERTNPTDADVEADVVVALLHDVIEDTDYPLYVEPPPGNEPDAIALTGRIAEAVGALTRRHDETYAEYIEHIIEAGEIAMTVKLADLHHNLSPERQACLPAKERKSLEKRYLKARDRIWEALGYRWWPEVPR